MIAISGEFLTHLVKVYLAEGAQAVAGAIESVAHDSGVNVGNIDGWVALVAMWANAG